VCFNVSSAASRQYIFSSSLYRLRHVKKMWYVFWKIQTTIVDKYWD
jgi:hypothetical protein